jgi:hypothetical protein
VLFPARDVAFILDFKRFYGAADIEFGLGLLRISHSHIRKFYRGLIFRGGLVVKRHEVNDIELISDIIFHIQRPILRMAIVKDDRVSSANRFRESQGKETGGIGLRSGRVENIGGDQNAPDGQLFTRVHIADNHGPSQSNGLLFLPANQREDAHGDQGNNDGGNPSLYFMSPSHRMIFALIAYDDG